MKTKFNINEEVYFINEYSLMNCLNKGTIIDITISKKHIVYVIKDEKDDIYFLTHKNIFKSFKEAKNYLMSVVMGVKDIK